MGICPEKVNGLFSQVIVLNNMLARSEASTPLLTPEPDSIDRFVVH